MRPLFMLCMAGGLALAQVTGGDVVDATTGAGLGGVRVGLMGPQQETVVSTDAAGHFAVPADAGVVRAFRFSRPGYLDGMKGSGRMRRGRRAEAPLSGNIRVLMTPQAVITGRVLDSEGMPVEGARVTVVRYQYVDGVTRVPGFATGAETNELGGFRVFGLPAGRWFLRVDSTGRLMQWDPRYRAQYRGGGIVPGDKAAIEVKAGQEVRDVEITLEKVEGHQIRGRVEMPEATGTMQVQPQVQLRAVDENILFSGWASSYMPDGSFVIRHVPPGKYVLSVTAGRGYPARKGDYMATVPVEVADQDVTDLRVVPQLVEPMTLEGALTVEGGGTLPPVLVVLSSNTGASVAPAVAGADGKFTFKDVLPGRYTLRLQPNMDVMDRPARYTWVELVSTKLGQQAAPVGGGIDIQPGVAGPLEVKAVALSARLTRRGAGCGGVSRWPVGCCCCRRMDARGCTWGG